MLAYTYVLSYFSSASLFADVSWDVERAADIHVILSPCIQLSVSHPHSLQYCVDS